MPSITVTIVEIFTYRRLHKILTFFPYLSGTIMGIKRNPELYYMIHC